MKKKPTVNPNIVAKQLKIPESINIEATVANSREEFLKYVDREMNPGITDAQLSDMYEIIKQRDNTPVMKAISDYKIANSDTREEAKKLLKILNENPEESLKIANTSLRMLEDENVKFLYRY